MVLRLRRRQQADEREQRGPEQVVAHIGQSVSARQPGGNVGSQGRSEDAGEIEGESN